MLDVHIATMPSSYQEFIKLAIGEESILLKYSTYSEVIMQYYNHLQMC